MTQTLAIMRPSEIDHDHDNVKTKHEWTVGSMVKPASTLRPRTMYIYKKQEPLFYGEYDRFHVASVLSTGVQGIMIRGDGENKSLFSFSVLSAEALATLAALPNVHCIL